MAENGKHPETASHHLLSSQNPPAGEEERGESKGRGLEAVRGSEKRQEK